MTTNTTEDFDLDALPTIVKLEGAASYCRELGFPHMSERFIKQAVQNGDLPYALISNTRHFAPRDVREWLPGMTAPRRGRS